jgi:hypothetical protein
MFFLLALAAVFFFPMCYASEAAASAPEIELQGSNGGPFDDIAYSARYEVDASNNYIGGVVGSFNSSPSSGNGIIVLMSNETLVSASAPYAGVDVAVARSIELTGDGAYIIAGDSTTGNHGGSDFWVGKVAYNPLVSYEWEISLGGSGYDRANALRLTADGGCIVVGESWSADVEVSAPHGGADAWVVKLDSAGGFAWEKSLGGSGDDEAYSVQQTSDGGYIIAGGTRSSDDDVIGGSHGDWDAWVVKLDAAGNILWQKPLGGSSWDYAYSIVQTSDGYIVAGASASNDGDVTGNHGGRDAWVVKLNTAGGIVWQKSLGGSNEDRAYSILQTADGYYIAAGVSASGDGDVTGNHGGEDCWVVKLDASGSIVWQKSFGGSGNDGARFIQQVTSDRYIMAGYSGTADGDVTSNSGGSDFWVVLLKEGSGLSATGVNLSAAAEATLAEANEKLAETGVSIAFGSPIRLMSDATLNEGGYYLVTSVSDLGIYVEEADASILPDCFTTLGKSAADITVKNGVSSGGRLPLLPMTYEARVTWTEGITMVSPEVAAMIGYNPYAYLDTIFSWLVIHKEIKQGAWKGFFTRLVSGVMTPEEAIANGILTLETDVNSYDGFLKLTITYYLLDGPSDSSRTEEAFVLNGHLIIPDGHADGVFREQIWLDRWETQYYRPDGVTLIGGSSGGGNNNVNSSHSSDAGGGGGCASGPSQAAALMLAAAAAVLRKQHR